MLYALVEAQAGLPEGSVANIMADNDAGKAVLYALVEAQVKLPTGSVANIMADNDAGKAVLYAIVADQMSAATGTTITAEQVAAMVAAGDPTAIAGVAAAKQAVVDGVATAKQTVVDGVAIAKQTVVDGVASAKQMVVDGVATARQLVAEKNIPETANTLYMLLVMPDTLGDVIAESEMQGLLALFARCVIGNGLGGHPSENGHDELARAVAAAYGVKTAEDKTDENLDMPELPVIKALVSNLTAKEYLNDDQILNIAFFAYGKLDDNVMTEEAFFAKVQTVDDVYAAKA